MNVHQRIMVIDEGGILRYDFSMNEDPFYLTKISSSLFSGMITAISAISNELGGSLQILVIGTEKLASRFIEISGSKFIIIVTDVYNCRDDLLLLKAEVVCRKITKIMDASKDTLIEIKMIRNSHLERIFENGINESLLSEILMCKTPSFLLKQIRKLPSPNTDLEALINSLAQELPSLDLISDPGLIIVNNMVIIPYDLQLGTRNRLYQIIKNTIEPIVGTRFLNSLLDRFSIKLD